MIVTEYFDVNNSRSIPWQRRPAAAALLAELGEQRRGFDAVVAGEPHRAFYGNQYGLTIPLFHHYGVPLWVPEVGGPIDPANEAHDLVMSVFGGMSKGERNRVRVAARPTATGSRTPGRTLTPPRRQTASGCTSSPPTRRPPRWCGGSSPSTWPAAASG